MKLRLRTKVGGRLAALAVSGILIVGGAISPPFGVALAQSAAPAEAATSAPTGPSTARKKPVSRTAKAGPAVEAAQAPAGVTTGSVAKMAGATAAAGAAGGKSTGRCTRMAFEVNDYGKDGPTKDAKELLDKHVAKWAADKGIKKYTVGKKVVNCRLFLDFGFFDEHTCRAEAPVCW